MRNLAPLLIVSVAALSGFVIGGITGFALAGHSSSSEAIAPRNRFLALLTQPTATMSSGQTLAIFALVLIWLVLFFALCIAPVIVAEHFQVASFPTLLVGYSLAIGTLWLGRAFGRRLWWQVS